ncbi:hypothetical protein [Sporolactobacillus sp. KGMB 08714]|uniref:hypothetical protein n=1 Tax=Sporolactobacillus sp. KGMB 08714 TaxID=3064704 RepID=UPI002FBEBA7B
MKQDYHLSLQWLINGGSDEREAPWDENQGPKQAGGRKPCGRDRKSLCGPKEVRSRPKKPAQTENRLIMTDTLRMPTEKSATTTEKTRLLTEKHAFTTEKVCVDRKPSDRDQYPTRPD